MPSFLIVIIAISYFYLQNLQAKKFIDYDIQGFDVSRHQGAIAWQEIDPKKYAFVFIKATEGGDYRDPSFLYNWQHAHAQNLKVGAYHFFRNCKSGAEQAQNYIQTVPKKANSLPPVIDLEFQWNCPEVTADELQKQIQIMANQLQQHYEKRPIFYTTPNYYQNYIQGKFDHYSLWLQDFKHQRATHDKRPWLFWQYSNQGKIKGITGDVDLNSFRGTAKDLQDLTKSEQHNQP